MSHRTVTGGHTRAAGEVFNIESGGTDAGNQDRLRNGSRPQPGDLSRVLSYGAVSGHLAVYAGRMGRRNHATFPPHLRMTTR